MSELPDGKSLPPGWAKAVIENILAPLEDGRTLHQGWSPQCEKGPSETESEWGVLKTTAVQEAAFISDHNKRLPAHLSPRPLLEVKPGDILITCAGPRTRCGISCLVKSTRCHLMMSGKMYRFRVPEQCIDARFIEAYLQTADARDSIDRMKTGGSDSGLNLTHDRFRQLEVPIAPLAEQQRIVAAIEEQFSRLDAGVAALERVRQNLKRMRAAVLQAAATGTLAAPVPGVDIHAELERMSLRRREMWEGYTSRPYKEPAEASPFPLAIPDHWRIASLESLTAPDRVICYGILMPRVREGGSAPYVEVKDLRASKLSLDALHRTSQALHKAFPRSVLAAGDVVLAIRGSYDRAQVVPSEIAGSNVSRDVARIAPLPGFEPEYLAAYLMSPPALSYLRERARGVAVKGVNIADVRSMPVPFPPLEEQLRIAEELRRYESILDALENTVESTRVLALRSSILAAAFSGKLVPQDPTDKSASILLERIAAEQASSNGHKPRTRRAKQEALL